MEPGPQIFNRGLFTIGRNWPVSEAAHPTLEDCLTVRQMVHVRQQAAHLKYFLLWIIIPLQASRLGNSLPVASGAEPFSNFTFSFSWALVTKSNHLEACVANGLVSPGWKLPPSSPLHVSLILSHSFLSFSVFMQATYDYFYSYPKIEC